uniref:Virulence factor Mce family protein n=1 Tax=Bursaphelenchus xylophilus TaxID=6326 RepID=A0A1I7SRN4_BURXY
MGASAGRLSQVQAESVEQMSRVDSETISRSEYELSSSECSVEMDDLENSITARSGEFVDTAVSYLSQYSPTPSEVSVELGGQIKGLTGPLPDPVQLTDLLQTAASELSTAEDGESLTTCASFSDSENESELKTGVESFAPHPSDPRALITAPAVSAMLEKLDLQTARDQLDDYLNTATADVLTGRDQLDDYLNTATADVLTARDQLHDYLNTATADVLTARGHLDDYLNTATADVLTARDQLHDYLNTATVDVCTGKSELDLSTEEELMTAIDLGGSKDVATAMQRTDSCETGLSDFSVSDYDEVEAETNVEMDELWPQAQIGFLQLRDKIDTPKPEELNFNADPVPYL